MDCHAIHLSISEYKRYVKKNENPRQLSEFLIAQDYLNSVLSDKLYISNCIIKQQRIFFMHRNKPLLELHLYNILFLTTKAKLTNILKEADISDFVITNIVKKTKGPYSTSAIVLCLNIVASIKIQVKAHLGELEIKSKNKSSLIRCAPYTSLPEPSFDVNSTPSSNIIVVLSQPNICGQIFNYLNATCIKNLGKAVPRMLFFNKISFIASDAAWTNPKDAIEAANRFKFDSIVFDRQSWLLDDTYTVKTVLLSQYKLFQQDSNKLILKHLDLRGIKLTNQLLKIIANCFEISTLTLGETVSCVSLPQNLDVCELMIENNSDLTLRSFTISNLNVLKLYKCCRLEISENESDLLKSLYANNNLKELVIIGCDNVNGYKPSWQRNIEPIIILQIVVNHQNNIEKLAYKFESVPCLYAINISNNVTFIINSTL